MERQRRTTFEGDVEIVDGKQRLQAVRAFLNNQVQAFGYWYKNFTDRLPRQVGFKFHINTLENQNAVIQWYLELNSTGKAHTPEKLDRVRALLTQPK